MKPRIIATSPEHACSFWNIDGQVYRSPAGAQTDIHDLPQDKRWECSLTQWLHYRAVFQWAIDVA